MTVFVQYQPEKFAWDPAGPFLFAFTFEFIGPAAFEVYAETQDPDDITGESYLRDKIPPQYYTLRPDGAPPTYTGGTVQLAKGIVKDSVERISIERNTPIFQNVDWQRYTAFPIKVIEGACDKATMIIQELAYRKCNAGIAEDITQELAFEPYQVLNEAEVDFMCDRLVYYMQQMVANGQDCSNNLGGTGAAPRTDNSDDRGQLDFS